jgi:hypothetical protein
MKSLCASVSLWFGLLEPMVIIIESIIPINPKNNLEPIKIRRD